MTERHPVLGVNVSPLERHEAVDLIIESAERSTPLGVSALAVHGIMEAVGDASLQYRINNLEVVLADGQPVRWALRILHGVRLADRASGPDVVSDVCRLAAEQSIPIFLYGSSEETLGRLESRLIENYPGLVIAGTQASRFRPATPDEQAGDIARIRASGAKLTLVGLGCPRQEIWTFETRLHLSMPVLAVGAAFDFHAGLKRRAPLWMQKRGLEWLFRLLQEPRRLWKRYLLLNPAYLTLLGLDRLGVYRIPTDRRTIEPSPIRPS